MGKLTLFLNMLYHHLSPDITWHLRCNWCILESIREYTVQSCLHHKANILLPYSDFFFSLIEQDFIWKKKNSITCHQQSSQDVWWRKPDLQDRRKVIAGNCFLYSYRKQFFQRSFFISMNDIYIWKCILAKSSYSICCFPSAKVLSWLLNLKFIPISHHDPYGHTSLSNIYNVSMCRNLV